MLAFRTVKAVVLSLFAVAALALPAMAGGAGFETTAGKTVVAQASPDDLTWGS
ncbi:hypothetical protein ACFSL4_36615 [Streptomyces caeni]|uniref:Uncharacterized protein n=1 Tax=Streptomyces caeni TaxID=2307231 RepID=A0ABW4J3Q0_9ACTN